MRTAPPSHRTRLSIAFAFFVLILWARPGRRSWELETVNPKGAGDVAPPPASAEAVPFGFASAVPWDDDPPDLTLDEQRAQLFQKLVLEYRLGRAELDWISGIFAASSTIGQGNPTVSRHPMTRSECRRIRSSAGLYIEHQAPCRHPNMVPLYDPKAGETALQAKVCIDQFEFPNIPCEYPVTYVRANEAAEICWAVGKRLCDAHEWEGGCAGALHAPEVEYAWGNPRPYATWLHNKYREIRWAYGPRKDHNKCATLATKSPRCEAGGWTLCGTNTWPAGSFLNCVSPLGVYDQHGNAAEHMNLPLDATELGSIGGTGATEMKGSWFIFARAEAHEDDCRWRAKDWHPSALMDENSHRNYHLGFRCCEDVGTDR